jgi:peptidoglycan hydrolase-like protein with peptidoglycan-binding domain
MKKMMGLVLGLAVVGMIVGCQKKEAHVSVEEPIVTEETSATAIANLEMNSSNMGTAGNAIGEVTSAMDAASAAVQQVVTAVIENPTPQQIQEALKSAGYYDGKIDGTIGPKTKKAIERFQTENGLKADGKVGHKTWAKLGTHLASSAVDAASAITPVTEPILGVDSAVQNNEVTSN